MGSGGQMEGLMGPGGAESEREGQEGCYEPLTMPHSPSVPIPPCILLAPKAEAKYQQQCALPRPMSSQVRAGDTVGNSHLRKWGARQCVNSRRMKSLFE
jgi:hypothetical protein